MGTDFARNVVVEMTWKEFKQQKYLEYTTNLKITDIECPKCGNKIYVDTTTVLTSYPPQQRYTCLGCGWTGIG